ncbi:MAG: hypothetical protein Q7V62_16025, partial [Actinomycetota bacterium]|nr:hypothetical protein [Actinomycetota bacterium]
MEANGILADGGTVRLTASGTIDLGGSVSADAGANGRGGTIVAIADLGNAASRTDVTGGLSAKGGTQSGDGGFVETSASHLKIAGTARVDTSAANGRTGSWLLDPTDFTVAASGGDITGSALATLLGSSNVTIQTGTGTNTGTDRFGTSGTNGDVFVNDTVSWSANTLLTLRAARSIFVNSAITASGSTGSGVALEFGQALALADPPPVGGEIAAIRAPINLAANSSFSMKYRSDGATDNYTVIASEAALRGISNMTGKFALGADISTSGSEWTPIGTDVVPFGGQFDGLGHTVSGLHRDQGNESNVGMFASIDFTGMVRNLKLTGVNFAGMNNVGALAGQNSGLIFGVSAAGTVT